MLCETGEKRFRLGQGDGLLRVPDQLGDLGHVIRRRSGAQDRAPPGDVLDLAFHVGELDVERNADEHGTRSTARGHLQRRVEDVNDLVGPDAHPGSLRDGPEQGDGVVEAVVVELLHAGPPEEVGGTSTSDKDRGRGVVHHARDAAQSIHHAGTFRDDDRRDSTGHPVVGIRLMDSVGLVLCLDPQDVWLVDQGIEQRPDSPAGIPEVVLDSDRFEPLRNGVDDSHGDSSVG